MIFDRDSQPGDILRTSTINALWAAWRSIGKITGVPPIYVDQDVGGTTVSAMLEEIWWIKLGTGDGSGNYAWTRQVPGSTPGTWVVSPMGESGTTTSDPAIEANGNALIPANTFVAAWREPSSDAIVFLLGHCP
ncbi:MAG: hypothetical protein P4L84_11170 [Isosphaeraceae bacterium]|nr:hypothetical protein [Isosphaeraceae bacterium]